MKKVLLLNNYRSGELEKTDLNEMQKSVSGLDSDICDVYYSSLDNLSFLITKGHPAIFDHLNGIDLSEYDMVIMRNTHHVPSLDAFLAVGIYLDHNKVKIIDGVTLAGAFIGKLSQMFLFCINGVAAPDTVVSRRYLQASLEKVGVSAPFIFKASDGIKGNKNYLIQNIDDVNEIYAEQNGIFLAQRFIKNDGDYRVLYVGNQSAPLVFRRKGDGESHTNNTSQGGAAELVNDVDSDALRMADKVYELSGKDLVGVDLIQDKDSGAWFVLEANTTPALFSGAFLDEKRKMFEEYLGKECGK